MPKKQPKSFSSRVEAAGEFMDFSVRVMLGFVFAFGISSASMWLGSQIWIGLGLLFFISAFPFGFLLGYFWLEVKFFLSLLVRLVLSFWLP